MLVFDVVSPQAPVLLGYRPAGHSAARRFDFTHLRLQADGRAQHEPSLIFVAVDARNGSFTVKQGADPVVHLNGVATTGGTMREGDRLTWGQVEVRALAVEAPPASMAIDWPAVLASAESRAVFCDQLEASGAVRCAEYARLAGRPVDAQAQARLAQLLPEVWRFFRVQVAKTPIRRCGLEQCPGTWERLERTNLPAKCHACAGSVMFCSAADEVRQPGRFALDPAVPFEEWMNHSLVQKGRPLMVDGVSETAVLRAPPATRALVESLGQAARAEHASVATFARTLCELMALGAPLELLERTQAALADEVRHVELTLRQLERLGARGVAFGRLPAAVAPLRRALAEFVEDVRAGARFEQEATDEARREAANTTDPELRAFYEVIAGDEARHAQLALDTVTWLEAQRD